MDKTHYHDALDKGMDTLKQSLSALIEKLPEGVPIIYFDYPLHLNIGDLLINVGLEGLLAAHNRAILYRINTKDYKRFLYLVKDEYTILLHGGGNFGDIWPSHEALRQEVVGRFTKNKIVLFPQTAHFNDSSKIEQYARVYREHPDFFMFLRDTRSYAFIKEKFGIPCALAPDTAHFLWQENDFKPDTDGFGEMIFMRRDAEASIDNQKKGSIDWDNLLSYYDYIKFRAIDVSMRINRFEFLQNVLQKAWYKHRDKMIRSSVRYYNKYNAIHTDRLHGMILGCLLRKKVSIKDNYYGKLTSYHTTWLQWVYK